MAKKKKKAIWIQDGNTLTLIAKAPRKLRRPVMLYSVEFNFDHSCIDPKKKVRYNRKRKQRLDME